ncbi:hypothetical protein KBC86_00140 [Candidatus Gracilibacteria bacterium]|nr:hypothetical protein [Candidatus Gracilibacteria bacterium]
MKKLLFLLSLLLLPIHSLFASDAETDKLQWHLSRVEGVLRKVDTSSLPEAQKSNRIKMLDRLHSYTEAGKFPNNDKFPGESVPFFRGSNGNLCAVGYLMDADPEYKPFIETIVQTNNNIELMDVQDDPIVNAWANKYGFSILELAMIQPTYDEPNFKNQGEPYLLVDYVQDISFYFLWIALAIIFLVSILIEINPKKLRENKKLILPKTAKFILIIGLLLLILSLTGLVYGYVMSALKFDFSNFFTS